jgi:hypothetical protein
MRLTQTERQPRGSILSGAAAEVQGFHGEAEPVALFGTRWSVGGCCTQKKRLPHSAAKNRRKIAASVVAGKFFSDFSTRSTPP